MYQCGYEDFSNVSVLVTIISLNLGSQYRVEPTEIWVLITAAGADRGGSTQVLKAPVLKVV